MTSFSVPHLYQKWILNYFHPHPGWFWNVGEKIKSACIFRDQSFLFLTYINSEVSKLLTENRVKSKKLEFKFHQIRDHYCRAMTWCTVLMEYDFLLSVIGERFS